MIVTWKVKKVEPGPLSDKTVANVSRRITRLTSNRKFKIGISSNPQRRSDEHSYDTGNKYQEMVVLSESESSGTIRELESRLVSKHRSESDNKQGGGGGHLGKPPYYLYIIRSRPLMLMRVIAESKKLIRRLGRRSPARGSRTK